MLLNSIFTFILVMSNITVTSDANYQRTANISCTQKAQNALFYGSSNTSIYSIEGYIAYDGKINFSDEENFRVYNSSITYSLGLFFYYKSGSDTIRAQEFVLSDSVSVPIDFTYDSYDDDFSGLELKLWYNEEEFHTRLSYNGTNLSFKTYDYDSVFPVPVDYNVTFNGSSFYSSMISYINLYNDETTYQNGYDDGKQAGYTEGYRAASEIDSTAATIFSGIVTVGLIPVNFFLGILNFEVFGINIGAFVSALLTVAIIIIVIKTVTGNGGGKSD